MSEALVQSKIPLMGEETDALIKSCVDEVTSLLKEEEVNFSWKNQRLPGEGDI